MERIFDLAFAIEGENIRLEQDAGIGEIHVIDLHMIHLRLLAERAGLLPRLLPPVLPCLAEGNDEMHNLQIEQEDDGTIHLYQTQLSGMGGSDEHLMLHPAQATWLGARLLSLGQMKDGGDGNRSLPEPSSLSASSSQQPIKDTIKNDPQLF